MSLTRSGRRIVYTNQTPFETDVLYTNMYNMVNAAYLAQAVLGGSPTSNATLVSGIAVTQNTVPNMSVLIGAGCMFNFQQFDATAFGVVPSDTATTDKLYKLYIQTTQYNSAAVTPTGIGLPLTFTAPVSGTTNYLLQAIFVTQDVDSANRPYFNPADPQVPIYATEAQTRQDTILYSLKSAVSPSIPTPDADHVGLYVIAVATGATTIVNANISVYSSAPFITESLTQKISQTSGDLRYVTKANLQAGSYITGSTTGSANTYVFTGSPAYASLSAGAIVRALINVSNTGASTLNVNGLGAIAVLKKTAMGLHALVGGELIAASYYSLMYDGTQFQLIDSSNPTPYSSSVYRLAGAQTIGAGTTATLVWDTVDYSDPYGAITFTSTTKMVANKDGLYEVNCTCDLTPAGSTLFNLNINVNGVDYQALNSATIVTATDAPGYIKLQLDATDYVEVALYAATQNIDFEGLGNNSFQMTYLGV